MAFCTAHSNSHPLLEYSFKNLNPWVSWGSLHFLWWSSKSLKSAVVLKSLGSTLISTECPGCMDIEFLCWSMWSLFVEIPIMYWVAVGLYSWCVKGFMFIHMWRPEKRIRSVKVLQIWKYLDIFCKSFWSIFQFLSPNVVKKRNPQYSHIKTNKSWLFHYYRNIGIL